MYELLIANKENSKIWDVSASVTEVQLETVRKGSPSRLSFTLLLTDDINFSQGDIVRFSSDGELQFYGWCFTKEVDRWGVMNVICYDRVRYLKANATYAFYAMKASDIVKQVAEDLQIAVGDVADTEYLIPSMIKTDQACIDIIQDALNQTLLNTGKIYVLYDNGDGLSLKAADSWISEYLIGDKSLLLNYSLKTDIDSETYNSIKLVQPNQATGMNDVVVVEDSETIGRWGKLQLYQSVDGTFNTAQMTERAKQTLSFYNRIKKTFTVSSLGINGIRAGMMMRIIISSIDGSELNQIVLLERVTHTWKNDDHVMDLETLEIM